MGNSQTTENMAAGKSTQLSDATIARFGAYAAIILGILGMFYCLPFLYSSAMPDLVGAGFPFVGGAVIAGAGLIALSNLAKK